MQDMLKQLTREQKMLEQLVRDTKEDLLKNMSAEERIKGLTVHDLLGALSPETRAALAQLLKDNGSNPAPSEKK